MLNLRYYSSQLPALITIPMGTKVTIHLLILTFYSNSKQDVVLHNSSSLIPQWTQVELYSADALVCDDCDVTTCSTSACNTWYANLFSLKFNFNCEPVIPMTCA